MNLHSKLLPLALVSLAFCGIPARAAPATKPAPAKIEVTSVREADALVADKQYPEAEAAYRGLLKGLEGKEAAQAQQKIGQCMVAQEKLEEGVAEYRKVAAIPNVPPDEVVAAQLLICDAFESKRKFEEAIEEYKKTLALKDITPVQQATVHYQTARALRARNAPGDSEEIIAAYRKAIAIEEAWPVIGACAQLYLGKYLQDSNRHEEALVEYRKVVGTPGANEVYVKDANERIAECEKIVPPPAVKKK
jgi:tetratricopeptide (TPR) repeat protein